MNRQWKWISVVGGFVLAVLAGCSGADVGETKADRGEPAERKALEGDVPSAFPVGEESYVTQHDPGAVYSVGDLPRERGSYPQLDLNGLTGDRENRIVHRLKTEICTCGCIGDTIDECLVNDPHCETARILARQIIRAEAAGSDEGG